jgi:hypothetical protein
MKKIHRHSNGTQDAAPYLTRHATDQDFQKDATRTEARGQKEDSLHAEGSRRRISGAR